MPAFLSSDQWNAITGAKPIIELQVQGFGFVTVDENIKCDHCGKAGHVSMPASVNGCMYCEHMDLSRSPLGFDESEEFRTVLRSVPVMLEKAKVSYHNRFASKVRKR